MVLETYLISRVNISLSHQQHGGGTEA